MKTPKIPCRTVLRTALVLLIAVLCGCSLSLYIFEDVIPWLFSIGYVGCWIAYALISRNTSRIWSLFPFFISLCMLTALITFLIGEYFGLPIPETILTFSFLCILLTIMPFFSILKVLDQREPESIDLSNPTLLIVFLILALVWVIWNSYHLFRGLNLRLLLKKPSSHLKK